MIHALYNVELVAFAVLQQRYFCARRNYDNLSRAIRMASDGCLVSSSSLLDEKSSSQTQMMVEDEKMKRGKKKIPN
jgi:hypothetical protein